VAGPGQGPCLCTFALAFELLENLALAWHYQKRQYFFLIGPLEKKKCMGIFKEDTPRYNKGILILKVKA